MAHLPDGGVDVVGDGLQCLPEHVVGADDGDEQPTPVGELDGGVDDEAELVRQGQHRPRGLVGRDVEVEVEPAVVADGEAVPVEHVLVAGDTLAGGVRVAVELIEEDARAVDERVDVQQRLAFEPRCIG